MSDRAPPGPSPLAPPTPTPPSAPAPKAPHIGLVLAGLMLGILLAALDQTVVGTALYTIATDIGGFERFSWLITAYFLASAVVIPIAGKLSDLYGRRPVYLAGMGVFLLGSALCGLAQTMDQLIFFRAVQGLGGGAIFPVALATVADLFPPAERGRIGGMLAATFGLSSVIGPFVGGWIVDSMFIGDIDSWRWVFYVNLPVGAVAMTFVALYFPRIVTRKDIRIDWAGTATLTTTLVAGLMVFVLVQEGYAWTSPQTLGLAALTLAGLAVFVAIERRATEPIIPLTLFKNPIFTVSVLASVFAGSAMFAVITFMPTYLQGVVGMSATNSGTTLIPLSLAMVFGAGFSGAMTKRFGYKVWMMSGFALAIAGYLLLWNLAMQGTSAALRKAIAMMMLLGLGIGFTLQTFVIAVQNAVERRNVGVATSGITLFRTLGATVGITVLGLILNDRFVAAARKNIAPEWIARLESQGDLAGAPNVLRSEDALATMSAAPGGAEAIEAIKVSFAEAISVVFLVAAGAALVALLITAALKSLPMKTAEEYKDAPTPAAH